MVVASWVIGTLSTLIAAAVLSCKLSPKIPLVVLKMTFAKGAAAKRMALAARAPGGVVVKAELAYGNDPETRLDCYYPAGVEGTHGRLGTIVWVHGGAWISGDKRHLSPYLKILADRGYVVVGINYSLAPEAKHPTPARQVVEALTWLQNRSESLHIDPTRLVLAGDSAGAQIVAQVAAMTSNPTYATALGVECDMNALAIRGIILYCGIFDVVALDFKERFPWFLRTTLWAYTGSRSIIDNPAVELMSVMNWITADFPPPFISVGNKDPLRKQSFALAEALSDLGIESDALFFADRHQPGLDHQYQFDASLREFDQALDRCFGYLQKVVGTGDVPSAPLNPVPSSGE